MDETGRYPDQMPRTIGRYQVQESIGFGAMGAVYKAFDPLIKRTLAIKTLRLDIPRNSPQYKSFIDRFYHEARISGTLSHPNIVTLFDIGEEGGVPYLAMEFVEGETLASILETGVRFNPEKVISLVSQVASAVDYAHSKGVIHRDIKPSNLILYEADRVKVTDFGIAKLADTEMTQSGTLLGTPAYMSPEQAMGDKLDGRSDIFSLGVCAFEMLSGEQPFAGPNVTAILYKLVHVEPIEPANLEMNGLVPQKWREVFGKVLAKKPDDRYQNATEFVQDLEYCLGSWFGSAMLDTLVDEDAGAALRAAAAAASAPAPPPPPPAARLDDATTALPRPE
jgi:serine/threonine-protein kinase